MTILSFAEAVAAASYRPIYRSGAICPGCGSHAWHVGRQSAECASCATALPLAPRQPDEAVARSIGSAPGGGRA